MVTIVPHDKEGPLRHGDRPEVIARSSTTWNNVRVYVGAVGVHHGFVIKVHLFVTNLHDVARYRDDPLYEVLLGIFREFKDHNIPPLGVCDRNEGSADHRELDPVYEFVDEDMISHQEGRLHGARRNLKGLHDKGPNEKGQDNGNQYRFGVFAKDTLFWLNRPFRGWGFIQSDGSPFLSYTEGSNSCGSPRVNFPFCIHFFKVSAISLARTTLDRGTVGTSLPLTRILPLLSSP